jgi:hypothetical protein
MATTYTIKLADKEETFSLIDAEGKEVKHPLRDMEIIILKELVSAALAKAESLKEYNLINDLLQQIETAAENDAKEITGIVKADFDNIEKGFKALTGRFVYAWSKAKKLWAQLEKKGEGVEEALKS